MNALITDADYKQALSMARSLARKGIRVTLAAHLPDSPALVSRYCSQAVILPDPLGNKNAYVGALLEEVRRARYELLITLRDETTEYLSEHRDEFARHTRFALPSADIVRKCLNKRDMFDFCEKKGVPYPRTRFISDAAEVESALRGFTFPAVVKYPRGGGGSGNRYCADAVAVRAAFTEFARTYPASGLMPMIQEHIPGRHLDFYALCREGNVLASFQFAAQRTNPPSGGNAAKCVSIFLPQLQKLGERLCSLLGYEGIANIDLMQDERTGEIKLLEVNPRFGGMTPMAIQAGVDLPWLLWKLVVDGQRVPAPAYTKGLLFRSLFYDELYFGLKARRQLPRLLLEFFDPRMHYDVRLNDPRPLARQLAAAVRIIRENTKH